MAPVTKRPGRVSKPAARKVAAAKEKRLVDIQRFSLRAVMRESRQLAQLQQTPPSPPTTPPSRKTSSPRRRTPAAAAGAATAPGKKNLTPADEGWYKIKAILDEAVRDNKVVYLVDWEGVNPVTKMKWPEEWVDARRVTRFAKKAWKSKNKKKV